ncbi:MAG TPA: slipin family protein [Tepidisphaeraceae bacterium]|jgi:regulator of protease activity HflC (stomatin/prohibitin superfamily)
MYKTIYIKKHERGLWFRRGDFVDVLMPGTYRVAFWNVRRDQVSVVETTRSKFEHGQLDVLLTHGGLRDQLHVVDLNDTQRALVWKDDRLAHVLGPGRHAFWKTPYAIQIAVYDVNQFRFTHPRLQAILQHAEAVKHLDGVFVDAHEDVLLYRDGTLVETLRQGLHVFWRGTGKVTWKTVDRRELIADVAGQEIMTADKVTLRVNLLVTYQVADALKAVTAVADHAQALYRDAQLALRAAVGTRTLDALLSDKESVGGEVRNALGTRAGEYGVRVTAVGLRDIVLPGDMKTLLNQVIAATKEAEANLIRRREETAAARSQANTAKLLAENPALARLKELELLKEVLAGTKATFVFGQGDLSEQVRGLVAAEKRDA